ncbi:AlpA family phage regulatory protein [Pseudomonas sp. PDM09]|nr:AlpA family phage regulatory protein [Pseudomonas sp. PDM09]MBD9562188.1 AlpA family phage regulatory protein [Pseudomonas sp. PDM09]
MAAVVRSRKLPRAKRIGLRVVGWDSLEIEQWVVEC